METRVRRQRQIVRQATRFAETPDALQESRFIYRTDILQFSIRNMFWRWLWREREREREARERRITKLQSCIFGRDFFPSRAEQLWPVASVRPSAPASGYRGRASKRLFETVENVDLSVFRRRRPRGCTYYPRAPSILTSEYGQNRLKRARMWNWKRERET